MMLSSHLMACAACFGKSDSALAQGMNMGIFSLLAVVVFVLSGFAAFIIYLVRRSAALNASQPSTTAPSISPTSNSIETT
ncbi:MAG TPA: hypothetical protein VGE41_03280 [Verrucomicrobiae bacterium]|jgi:hypothetical protein